MCPSIKAVELFPILFYSSPGCACMFIALILNTICLQQGGFIMTEKSLTTLIDMAIQREVEAYDFYMALIEKLSDADIKDSILFIADEEKKHRTFLESYREGRYDLNAFRMTDVIYYKIAEHEKEPEINPDMSKEHVFLLAAHRELRSHKFYRELAEAHPGGEAKQMLLRMANEELKHKEKMEYLYANTAFPQTSGG